MKIVNFKNLRFANKKEILWHFSAFLVISRSNRFWKNLDLTCRIWGREMKQEKLVLKKNLSFPIWPTLLLHVSLSRHRWPWNESENRVRDAAKLRNWRRRNLKLRCINGIYEKYCLVANQYSSIQKLILIQCWRIS